ncbi:MAG: nitroreductase family protein [Myxococcales bacterium]|nr:nitroreductase family protein [Myxococcales bacterium]
MGGHDGHASWSRIRSGPCRSRRSDVKLNLSADEVLSTTRAVRKRLDFDKPVPLEVIHECLEYAIQAPTGSNAQGWQFVIVTDAEKRAKIGELYRERFAAYRKMPVSAHAIAEGRSDADRAQQDRVIDSAEYLAENLAKAPVFLIPCITGRLDAGPGPMPNIMGASLYGSIIPAAWSFMLAARERGLGTAWTTIHLMDEKIVADLLGIPFDEVTQIALIPVAYTKGTDFKPARRLPLEQLVHVDRW